MSLPSIPLVDGVLFVDNSHWVDPLMTCDRLLEYQSFRGRISREEQVALNFGTAQHLVREYRHKQYTNRPLDQDYHNGCASILSTFFEEHPAPSEDHRSLNWALDIAKRCDWKWSDDRFKPLKYTTPRKCDHCDGKGKPHETGFGYKMSTISTCLFCAGTGLNDLMVELSFALPFYTHKPSNSLFHKLTPDQKKWVIDLGGIMVMYSGRIDLPVLQDNFIWVIDYKTLSRYDFFWERMKMSSQQRGYCWSFRELTGMNVAGYVVRAIRTKEPPKYVIEGKPNRKGEMRDVDEWWNESLQDERTYVSGPKLEEWKGNTIEHLEHMFWSFERGYFRMETESCTKWGRCQYYDVCQMLPDERLVVLNSGLYKNNDWSPLKQAELLKCEPLTK
jgi:hypothetical protein